MKKKKTLLMIRIRQGVGNGSIRVITLYPPTEKSIIPYNIILYFIPVDTALETDKGNRRYCDRPVPRPRIPTL